MDANTPGQGEVSARYGSRLSRRRMFSTIFLLQRKDFSSVNAYGLVVTF